MTGNRSDHTALNYLADCVTGAEGARTLRSTATISGDVNVDQTSINIQAYIGKPSGTNADFTTLRTGLTTFTCTGLPGSFSAIGIKPRQMQ